MVEMDFGTWGEEESPTGSPLSWRLSAVESLADWKIVLRIDGNKTRKTTREYDVHRCQLAVKSSYFAGLFRSSFGEATARESVLDVKASAAEVFPSLLDFIYGLELRCDDAMSAVALRWLANYLGIRGAFDAVNAWSKAELEKNPCVAGPAFLLAADDYDDDKMSDIAAKVCGQHFHAIKTLDALPPKLVNTAFAHVSEIPGGLLSEKLASYFNNWKEKLAMTMR